MQVLGISVRQVVVGIEFTPDDLGKLRWFLDHCEIKYNGEIPFEKEAKDFVCEELYKTINSLVEEVNSGPR